MAEHGIISNAEYRQRRRNWRAPKLSPRLPSRPSRCARRACAFSRKRQSEKMCRSRLAENIFWQNRYTGPARHRHEGSPRRIHCHHGPVLCSSSTTYWTNSAAWKMFWSRLQLRNGDVTAFERERVIRLLERVGLGDQLHKRPGTMSGGRISVVRLSAPSQTSQRSFSLMSPQEILTAVREAKSSK